MFALFHLCIFVSHVYEPNDSFCDVYLFCMHCIRRIQQMIRMNALMKKVYGEKEYKKKESVDWVEISKKASFSPSPEQGPNECGWYVLKMAQLYDGRNFVVKFRKHNVSILFLSFFASNAILHTFLFMSAAVAPPLFAD